MRNLKHTVIMLVMPVVCSAAAPHVSPQASPQISPQNAPIKIDKTIAQRERLNGEVLRLSQPLTCKLDADCASLAMGAKPCGGPWKYVVYSKRNSKVSALKKKLDEYNKLDQKVNDAQQVMSDCSMTMEPEVKCVKSTCIAN